MTEVSVMFENINLPNCSAIIHNSGLDGEALCALEHESEIYELKLDLDTESVKRLFNSVTEFIAEGVPLEYLIEKTPKQAETKKNSANLHKFASTGPPKVADKI
jgi:hypothetical protein